MKLGSVLTAGLIATVLAAGTLTADQAQNPTNTQSPGLNLVPADATAFCRMRVGEFWKSEVFKKLHDDQAFTGEVARKFHDATGLKITDIDTVTAVVLSHKEDATEPACVCILTTQHPFERSSLMKTALPTAKEMRVGNKTYYLGGKEKHCALYFADQRTLVAAREPAMKRFLEAADSASGGNKSGGKLASALSMADKHPIMAAFCPHGSGISLSKNAGEDEWNQPFHDLQFATLAIDFADNKATTKLCFTFPDQAKAQTALSATKKGLEKAEHFLAFLGRITSHGKEHKETSGMILPVDRLKEGLRNAKVEQQEAKVNVEITTNLTAEDYACLIRAVAKGMFGDKAHE